MLESSFEKKNTYKIPYWRSRQNFKDFIEAPEATCGNEVRSNLSSETRLKVEVEDRLKAYEEVKAVEEGRKMEEERRMNEIIALEEEVRLKKKDGLWKSRCEHVQEGT
ncbi:hypothetical protein TNCV_3542571 [Trichonephila clavipes]|nr:hypothetical protein TNCV_3542571 [Trichonephila clavipes]